VRQSKFRVEAFEKKANVSTFPVDRNPRYHIIRSAASKRGDKQSWTRARVIRRADEVQRRDIFTPPRHDARAPTNQPLVGARICDNIKLRRMRPESKASMTR